MGAGHGKHWGGEPKIKLDGGRECQTGVRVITGGNGVAQEEHGGRQGMPNGVRVLIGGHGAEHGDARD